MPGCRENTRQEDCDINPAGESEIVASEAQNVKTKRVKPAGTQADVRALAAQLEAITPRLAEISADEKLRLAERIKAIQEIEDIGRSHEGVAARGFFEASRAGQEEERRLWQISREFWAQLAAAYNACLAAHIRGDGLDGGKTDLTHLVIRLLRAYQSRLKWDWFRHGPHSLGFWETIGHAYLYAMQEGVHQRFEKVYPGSAEPTSVEREYLRILMLQASSLDRLLPLEIRIVEEVVDHFLPDFSFSAKRLEGHTHWVDAARRRPPARLMGEKMETSPVQRFFGPGAALSGLAEVADCLRQGEAAPQFRITRYFSPRVILPVLQHLTTYWAPTPPRRRYTRYQAQSRMAVISGLTQINLHLCGAAAEALGVNENSEPRRCEWMIDNISRDGIGAQLRLATSRVTEEVRIGTLICMRPEGVNQWLVGVVRRFSRETEEHGLVGIETLTRAPLLTEVDCGGQREQALLLNKPRLGRTVRLVLRAGTGLCTKAPLLLPVEGKTAHLINGKLVETGIAFDIARYRVESLV